MANESDLTQLRDALRLMQTRLKNLPFCLVIEAMTGKRVLPFNAEDVEHREVLGYLHQAALWAGEEINRQGIDRPRPNEVGNDVERFVRQALRDLGLRPDTPQSSRGRKKATGYPDLLFWFNGHPYYLECKTYNADNIGTTQRSFYLSPSDEFKVAFDAVHFLMSFEIYKEAGASANGYTYKCKHYKILSLEELLLDVKYEFNSDNRRIYSGRAGTVILDEGPI